MEKPLPLQVTVLTIYLKLIKLTFEIFRFSFRGRPIVFSITLFKLPALMWLKLCSNCI